MSAEPVVPPFTIDAAVELLRRVVDPDAMDAADRLLMDAIADAPDVPCPCQPPCGCRGDRATPLLVHCVGCAHRRPADMAGRDGTEPYSGASALFGGDLATVAPSWAPRDHWQVVDAATIAYVPPPEPSCPCEAGDPFTCPIEHTGTAT